MRVNKDWMDDFEEILAQEASGTKFIFTLRWEQLQKLALQKKKDEKRTEMEQRLFLRNQEESL
jgi:hypothetical protein